MSDASFSTTIDEAAIAQALRTQAPGPTHVREILAKAREMHGLSAEDIAALTQVTDPALLHELFATAKDVKQEIYGSRLVMFAPMYISNFCGNECLYCAFRASNKSLHRRALNQEEIAEETRSIIRTGHKRILLVAGEAYPPGEGFDYIIRAIRTVYATKEGNGEIRRLNVNLAPLSVEQYRALKAEGIGTYQLFQESYHRESYRKYHVGGRKADYDHRLAAPDRAMEGGIDDIGIGALFGLTDWRFEVLAMMQHIRHLEDRFGVGPHTLSVPRLEPACGSDLAAHPPQPVSDDDFRKLVAILRLAVPYTGIIMSTRETPAIRRDCFALGVSQISAGSRTNPGGYHDNADIDDEAQFSLGDHRPLDEVVRDIAELGYVPSFCTGCYRLGRTGADFMDLAKPGAIKAHCEPNALSTFTEYLVDYASPATRTAGEAVIQRVLDGMKPHAKARAQAMIDAVRDGKRDVFV